MDDKGDVRLRAIAELALAVETGGGIEPAVQAAYLAVSSRARSPI